MSNSVKVVLLLIAAAAALGVAVAGFCSVVGHGCCERAQRPVRKDVRTEVTRSVLKGVRDTLETYKQHMGRYPTAAESWGALVDRPADPILATRWRGPYIETREVARDAWGHPLVYRPPPPGQTVPVVYSFGPNGEDEGGEGDDISG